MENASSAPPKVSVVIPIYNTETFLNDCLKSLAGQTLDGLEFICVNDGSTDSSLQILEKFAENDGRFVIVNQENKGLSAARNMGMSKAKGKYIGFMDSDDFADKDYYQKLYEAAEKYGADVACASVLRKKGDRLKKQVEIKSEGATADMAEKLRLSQTPTYCFCYNKIYRREAVETLRFDEDLRSASDIVFAIKAIGCTGAWAFVPGTNYYYVLNMGSVVKSKKMRARREQDLKLIIKRAIDFADSCNMPLDRHSLSRKETKYLFGAPVVRKYVYGDGAIKYVVLGIINISRKGGGALK